MKLSETKLNEMLERYQNKLNALRSIGTYCNDEIGCYSDLIQAIKSLLSSGQAQLFCGVHKWDKVGLKFDFLNELNSYDNVYASLYDNRYSRYTIAITN